MRLGEGFIFLPTDHASAMIRPATTNNRKKIKSETNCTKDNGMLTTCVFTFENVSIERQRFYGIWHGHFVKHPSFIESIKPENNCCFHFG